MIYDTIPVQGYGDTQVKSNYQARCIRAELGLTKGVAFDSCPCQARIKLKQIKKVLERLIDGISCYIQSILVISKALSDQFM